MEDCYSRIQNSVELSTFARAPNVDPEGGNRQFKVVGATALTLLERSNALCPTPHNALYVLTPSSLTAHDDADALRVRRI